MTLNNQTSTISLQKQVENQYTFLKKIIEIDKQQITVYGKLPKKNEIYTIGKGNYILDQIKTPPSEETVFTIRKAYTRIEQVIRTIQLLEIPLLEEKEELTLQNAFENKKYNNLFLFIKEIHELELIKKGPQQYLFDNRFTSDDSDNFLAQDAR
ncbi:30708_t:CDS:1 [Racocetra persica]|uniref:30708_t:CDS:1 n=1 Tax=Racocetra persica TaxID=160502 RepID=A0ACA9NKA1_9GLOM|nr:30708_t:CDS:1 [Racocetra persica]